MNDKEKCLCPLCTQPFSPENGDTPEEHLAKGIIRVVREIQNSHHEQSLSCPRCGQTKMKPTLIQNAISRYTDVYICSECATDESLCGSNDTTLALTAWYAVRSILDGTPDAVSIIEQATYKTTYKK